MDNNEMENVFNSIPNYQEFLTVSELDKSSKQLAEDFDHVEILEIGKSKEGRIIYCLKIGNFQRNALLFAFPHPNEPIGSLTVEFLARFLAENPDTVDDLGYTWYLIKAIDPDGAALNEGWFKGEFDPVKYARNNFGANDHNTFCLPGAHHAIGNRKRVDKSGTNRLNIKSITVIHAEHGLNLGRG